VSLDLPRVSFHALRHTHFGSPGGNPAAILGLYRGGKDAKRLMFLGWMGGRVV